MKETAQKTILVVDDSLLIVERVVTMLEELESIQSIKQAGDYIEATGLLADEQPDIILLDIQLPGKNGIELLKFIKNTYPGITVIMLSNESGDFYRNLCKEEGASYFIDKSKEFELIPEILASFPLKNDNISCSISITMNWGFLSH